MFSAGLQILLQELCPGVAFTTADGIEKVVHKTRTYELILLDINMPDSKEPEGLARCKLHCSAVPVVLVSSELNAKTICDCIDQSAMGYVANSSKPAELMKAMTSTLAGETFLLIYCLADLQSLTAVIPALQLSPS